MLARSLETGGAERQLAVLAVACQTAGHRVSVLTFYPGGDIFDEVVSRGVSVQSLGKRRRWDVVVFWLRLVRRIRHLRPDVLYSFLGVPNVVAAVAKPFVPRTRIVWGVRSTGTKLDREDWAWSLAYRMEAKLARFADLIIVNSFTGRRDIAKRGFRTDHAVVLPNGIDVERYVRTAEGRRRVRGELGLDDETPLVGTVARVDPAKGYELFLDAVAVVHAERPHVRFLAVGSGDRSYEDTLRRRATALGIDACLTWAGRRNDMPAVYSALDLAVLCSRREGFPNAIAEAMACGVYCVVTDAGDADVLLGDTGTVVRSRNARDIAMAWCAALDRVTNHDPERVRARVCELFGANALLERTIDALERIR